MTTNTEPFGYSTYQPSTIGLETKRFGDGKEWHEAGKAIKMDYFTNKEGNDSLNCMHLEASVSNEDIDIKYINNYPTGSLLVTQNIDEDGKTSYTFKDTFGKTLLTRRKLTTNNKEKFLDTYYIYDKIDQLIAVVPPAMTMLVANNFVMEDWIYAYIYAYKYDGLGRNIAKKLPGRDWIYMAYDKNDRLIYSQDGEQRKKGQLYFQLYDIFGRECVNGTCKGTNIPDIDNTDITCKYTGNNKDLGGYECKAIMLNDAKVQAINYYDNYKFLKNETMPYMFQGAYKKTEGYATLYDTPQGLCTGTVRKILEHEQEGDGVFSAYYYDALGRVAQKRTFNDMTENEATYYKYNITDAPVKVRREYGNSNIDTEVYEYTYDKAKRLVKETLALDGASPIVLCENEYDELGRLAKSKNDQNENFTTEYGYNNRSWLTSINSPLFMENLYYNNTGTRPLYSGKIAKIEWKTTKNNLKRNYYQFHYDDLGRITRAQYGTGRTFAEIFDYDDMGNVTKLQRGGLSDDGKTCAIDHLALKYFGNQLLKVTDSSEGPYYKGTFHFIDGADEDMEYDYDANGNMTMDLNKGITSITYNDRNLPQVITFKLKDDLTQTETEESIEYYYDSDGEKRGVSYSSTDDYIAYTENRVFENGDIKYLFFDGGYASFENGEKNPTYHFYVKDHIGNNRIVADAQGNVEQENHYYPSGTLIMGSKFTQDITSNQRYRFGGKELDRMYGLDWYDFGARMYNPLLNCWTTMDPLCEKYYDISPYVYCNNEPINIFDPNGTRIYLLFYSYGNSDSDINSDFYASALTRYYDITNSKDYDAKKDHIFLLGFNDLAKIKDTTEGIISKYSKQYGKTAEVDFYTHGGFDGPMGTINNYDYFEFSHDQYQMSLEGWNNISFNWEKNANIYFYGCNTANTNEKHPISFSQKNSKLENFRNINVYGQASSVYFSNNNHSYQKRKNIPIIHKNNTISFPRTYMISPIWGRYCFINGRLFPMTHYMNNQQIK